MIKNGRPVDKNFDGHPEKPMNGMTPVEKLDEIWKSIELKNYINKNISKKKPASSAKQ